MVEKMVESLEILQADLMVLLMVLLMVATKVV